MINRKGLDTHEKYFPFQKKISEANLESSFDESLEEMLIMLSL